MRPERYVQEFTDPETGEIDGVTFEPIEIWTEAGLEIIPPGFRFSFQSIPKQTRKLLRDDEIPLCILREWHKAAGNSRKGGAEHAFRVELIKGTRKRQNATVGRFWRFVKDRTRVEVICLMVRSYGIIARWYIAKNKSVPRKAGVTSRYLKGCLKVTLRYPQVIRKKSENNARPRDTPAPARKK